MTMMVCLTALLLWGHKPVLFHSFRRPLLRYVRFMSSQIRVSLCRLSAVHATQRTLLFHNILHRLTALAVRVKILEGNSKGH